MKNFKVLCIAGAMAAVMAMGMTGCGKTDLVTVTYGNTTLVGNETTDMDAEDIMNILTNNLTGKIDVDFTMFFEKVYDTDQGDDLDMVVAEADELKALVQQYSEDITEQNMASITSDKLSSLCESCDDSFVEDFSEAFDAVVSTAVDSDEDLETDVTFNQIVNAVNSQLEVM